MHGDRTLHQGDRLVQFTLIDGPRQHLQRARGVLVRAAEQPLLYGERLAQAALRLRIASAFDLFRAEAEETLGKRRIVALASRQRALQRDRLKVRALGARILCAHGLEVRDVAQRQREFRLRVRRQFAPFRGRRFQQWLRLVVQAKSHVHRAEGVHQGRLNAGLVDELRLDPRRALVQYFACGQAATARHARVGDPEQVNEKRGGLTRGLCLALGDHGLVLGVGAGDERGGGESAGEHHAGEQPGGSRV